jgi:hypothetical protein
VALCRKHKDEARFVVVDLSRPSPEQKSLVSRLYRGFIQTLAFLDRGGKVVYDRAGETSHERGDASALESILRTAKVRKLLESIPKLSPASTLVGSRSARAGR